MLGDSEAELGQVGAVDIADVYATQDFALSVDEHKVQRGALSVLKCSAGEAVIEVLEVFVSAVTNSRGEEGPVSPFEPFEGPGVVGGEELQPGSGIHG